MIKKVNKNYYFNDCLKYLIKIYKSIPDNNVIISIHFNN
jgi:hypothetical protein